MLRLVAALHTRCKYHIRKTVDTTRDNIGVKEGSDKEKIWSSRDYKYLVGYSERGEEREGTIVTC